MDIPFDILKIVSSFLTIPKMKLLDWIPLNKLKWDGLLLNPNAYDLIKSNTLYQINWEYLSKNPIS